MRSAPPPPPERGGWAAAAPPATSRKRLATTGTGGLPTRGWRPHLLRLAPASREGGGIRSALLAASRKRPAAGPQAHGRGGAQRRRWSHAAPTCPPASREEGGSRSCSLPACASSPPPDHGKGGFMRIAPPRLPREGGGRPPRRPPLHGSGWRLPARAGGRPPHTRVEAALVASCPRLPGGGGHSFRLARRFTEAAGGRPPGTRERGPHAATAYSSSSSASAAASRKWPAADWNVATASWASMTNGRRAVVVEVVFCSSAFATHAA